LPFLSLLFQLRIHLKAFSIYYFAKLADNAHYIAKISK